MIRNGNSITDNNSFHTHNLSIPKDPRLFDIQLSHPSLFGRHLEATSSPPEQVQFPMINQREKIFSLLEMQMEKKIWSTRTDVQIVVTEDSWATTSRDASFHQLKFLGKQIHRYFFRVLEKQSNIKKFEKTIFVILFSYTKFKKTKNLFRTQKLYSQNWISDLQYLVNKSTRK